MVLLLLASTSLFAQNRTEISSERTQIEKRIALTNELLSDLRNDRNVSSEALKTLKHQITGREQLIVTIQNEMGEIDQDIINSEDQIHSLQKSVQNIREEYFEILRMQQRQNLITNEKWLYLFSAKSLKDLILRYTYSKRFEQYAKDKINLLKNTLSRIEKRTTRQIVDKQDKEQLLIQVGSAKAALRNDIKEQAILLDKIKRDETSLLADLRVKEKEKRKLDDLIKGMINSKPMDAPTITNSSNLKSNFAANKGKLPWPVNNGFILNAFGERNHEVLQNVKVYNNGIDIRTTAGNQVVSVFDGIVMEVVQISESGKMILIRHEKFLTAYLNLADVSVQKGDTVQTGSPLGSLTTDSAASDLQFQIWRESEKLNPSEWLTRK